MSFNFGSSSGTSRNSGSSAVSIPPPDPQEQRLRGLNIQLAEESLADIRSARAQQNQREASGLTALQQQIERSALENLRSRITGEAPLLSDVQQARLDQVYGRAQSEGDIGLERFARDLASSRGLSTADSPIGGEALDQRRRFGEGLAAAKAAASLDLGHTEDIFNQQVAGFQNDLAQRAFQNRLAMAGMTPAAYGLQSGLFGERLAGAGRSFSTHGNTNTTEWNAGLSGQGAAGYGTALFGSAGFFGCWIAAAIYGTDSSEFYDAREWIFRRWTGPLADLTRWIYLRIGRQLAPHVKTRPWLKALLKPLFDRAVRKTRKARRA